MRRKVGVGRVQQQSNETQRMRDFANQLDAESIARAQDEIDRLEQGLMQFGKQYEAELRRDPVLRARLKAVADAAGIDVFRSSRSRVSKALGIGNYSFDLAARVVEYCMSEARVAGSTIPLPRVVRAMNGQTPDDDVSAGDVSGALQELSVFGPAYTVIAAEKGVHEGFVVCQSTPVAGDVARLVALALKRSEDGRVRQVVSQEPPAASVQHLPPTASASANLAASSTTRGGGERRSFTLRSAGVSVVRPSAESGAGSSSSARLVRAPPPGSKLTVESVSQDLAWGSARATEALDAAIVQADVWVDDVDQSYWFPAAWVSTAV